MDKSLAEKMRIAAGGKPRPTPENLPKSVPGQAPPVPWNAPPVTGQLPPKKQIKVKKKNPPHVSDR